MGQFIEKGPEQSISFCNLIAVDQRQLVVHEIISKVDHKVRFFFKHVFQRKPIGFRYAIAVKMRICFHSKAEAFALLALCLKTMGSAEGEWITA